MRIAAVALALLLGFVTAAGAQTIEDSHHSTRGYIRGDGTIEDSSHSTVGYIRGDGTIENRSHSTIGHAPGVRADWVAVVFFFIKF